MFICSWGHPTDPRPVFPSLLPCHFNLLPCDTETGMEKVKRFLMSAIAKDLASKGLVTDCEFDDEFLIRYIMASCYRTVYENNLQDQMVYILGFEQCEESGTCTETYRYCIDLNEPNGPPVIAFQTKVSSEVNQQIQCTADWNYVPNFNPAGPQIIYSPCFGMCNEVNE